MELARLQALGQLDQKDQEHSDESNQHQPDETDEALRAFGLRRVGSVHRAFQPVAWLWPECLDTWNAWCAVQTQWQWRTVGGLAASSMPTGLRYEGVVAWLTSVYGARRGRSRRLLLEIQSMEWAAISALRTR